MISADMEARTQAPGTASAPGAVVGVLEFQGVDREARLAGPGGGECGGAEAGQLVGAQQPSGRERACWFKHSGKSVGMANLIDLLRRWFGLWWSDCVRVVPCS